MATIINATTIGATTGGKYPRGATLAAYKFRWVAPTAVAGDQCVVQDENNATLWEAIATGPNFEKESDFDPALVRGTFNGARVDSGKLYIYLVFE